MWQINQLKEGEKELTRCGRRKKMSLVFDSKQGSLAMPTYRKEKEIRTYWGGKMCMVQNQLSGWRQIKWQVKLNNLSPSEEHSFTS